MPTLVHAIVPEARPQVSTVNPPPARLDHPVAVGPAVHITVVGTAPPPPPITKLLATPPIAALAEVRDGVAMFGTGPAAGHVVTMGSDVQNSIAQTTAANKLQTPGSSNLLSQTMDLQHLIFFPS